MNLSGTQLKDTYGNLVTTGTSAGSPTTGGLQNGDGSLLTAVGIGTNSPSVILEVKDNNPQIQLTDSVNASAYSRILNTDSGTLYIDADLGNAGSNSAILFRLDGGNEKMRIEGGGDISFRDTSANEAFYWDASTARLGLGTATPNHQLEIYGGSGAGSYNLFRGFAYNGTTNKRVEINIDNTESDPIAIWNTTRSGGAVVEHSFQIDSSEKMRIDSSGNVGINETNPSRTLHVSSGTTNEVAIFESTDTEVTLEFKDTTGTSKIKSRADFRFETGATPTEAMRINSSGNVGIGTDSILGSATRLHLKVDDSNTDFSLGTPWHLLIENDNTGTNTGAMLGLRANNADGGIALHYGGSTNTGYMTFHVDAGGSVNGERMRIDSSGNVLVGKTAVAFETAGVALQSTGSTYITRDGGNPLDIRRNTNDGDILKFWKDSTTVGSIASRGGTTTAFITNPSSGNGAGLTGSTNMLIPSSETGVAVDNRINLGSSSARFKDLYLGGDAYIDGELGIGTSSPSAPIQISKTGTELSGTGNSYGFFITPTSSGEVFIDAITGSSGNTSATLRTYNNGTYTEFIKNASGNTTTFETAGTERMRIQSSGHILFGGINALPDGTTTYGSGFRNDANDVMGLRLATSTTSAQTLVEFFNPNGSVGSIQTNASATAYNTSSDYRLKENVIAMTGALDRVDQLKPSRFNFIADADKTVDGFLAHEVANVIPEAISGEKDAVDEEGNPIYQGIDQSKLVPLLVGAIQELRAEIEQLKNQ